MAQMGLIDPTKAVMAGMMIDRITKSNMQPPEQTVADEALMQMATPMQQPKPLAAPAGLGALPNQPEPNAGVAALPSGITEMAGGGIVAFDDGGEVPGYAGDEGSFVRPSLFSSSMPAPSGFDDTNQTLRLMSEAAERDAAATAQRKAEYNQRLESIRQKMVAGVALTPQEATLARYNNLSAASTLTAPVADKAPDAINVYRQITSPSSTTAAQDSKASTPVDRSAPGIPQVRSGTAQRQPAAQAQPAGVASLIEAPKPMTIDPNLGKFETKAYKMPEKKELKDFLARQEDAERQAGVNTNIYKDLMNDLEGKKGKLAERKQEALGNALMQTGLGLIGARRGEEFAVLGASGQRSLQGLINANEKIRDTEDKIDDARRSLLVAENDYKRTRSDKALQRVEANEAKIEALEIKNIDNTNEANRKQAEIGVQIFGKQVDLRGQDVQVRGQDIQRATSLETTKMTTDAQRDAARIHAAAANRPGETERMMATYDRILRTQGPEAAEKYIQLQERFKSSGRLADENLQMKYASEWNKMDPVERANYKKEGITTQQQYIDNQLRLAGRQPTPAQNAPRSSLQANPDGSFNYVPSR